MYTVYMDSKNHDISTSLELPLFSSKVACGFPSPADDHIDVGLNLNQHLITHPAATFFVRAEGESMCDAGILHGDLLVVDKSLSPKENSIVIAILNGELTVKRLRIIAGAAFLYPANKHYKPIPIADIDGIQIWGVVTYAIHDLCPS